ncbi:MAG: hypothetical protein ACXWTY_16720 [Methylobacter sp.]
MINAYLLKRNKPKSLRPLIKAAERELLNRQQRVGVRTATVRNSHQQVAAAAILVAGGIGYILLKLFSFLNIRISKKFFRMQINLFKKQGDDGYE